ncbi:Fis family transcriptional regulator [Mycobacteroides abscessus subsp. abscessus]|uniref:DUF3263 domain-containing protein n=1 Tax=Mycobacteroides abscessus TaxID=36809 RepID=UPI00092AF9C6|nr:DUF3263 domain-containing protein [Mycobacteroides abscessus]SIK66299.1 Fis family transcriptional regulator [Mycobacteroides abscessus subsp. abscessus]
MNTVEALAMERIWWPASVAKHEAIRERFGLSPVRYYQKLNAIIETPEALAIDAQTVNRLRRIRG